MKLLKTVTALGAIALVSGGIAFAQMNHQGHSMGQGMAQNMGQGMMAEDRQNMMGQMSEMMSRMAEMMKMMEAGGTQHDMAMGEPKGDQGPSSKAFAKANAEMHAGMDIEFSGDSDADFVKGMIPHHQGAVAMAKIVLEHGKDAELKKLAEAIVAAQEAEIAFMREWLQKNGK